MLVLVLDVLNDTENFSIGEAHDRDITQVPKHPKIQFPTYIIPKIPLNNTPAMACHIHKNNFVVGYRVQAPIDIFSLVSVEHFPFLIDM